MKKKCKVVALPTNEKTKIVYNGEAHAFFQSTSAQLNKKDDFIHLYIVSDDNIKEGDIMILKKSHSCGRLRKCHWAKEGRFYIDPKESKGWGFCYQHEVYKVVATTDPSLNLPLIYDGFVKDYCDANGIEEVYCEFLEEYFDISIIKQSYTREEVERLCRKAFISGWNAAIKTYDEYCIYQDLEDEFINNNL